jgi:signal transduction histidine kinase
MDGPGIEAEINALIVGMIGMFFLTLIIILFVVVYQRKLLRQERRHKQAEEAHQLELLQATIEIQEVERDRIGRELHDGVGVMLSTTRMHLDHWKEADEQGKVRAGERIDQLLGDTIESVRRVSADLRPVVLETLGLAEAIGDLVTTVMLAAELQIEYHEIYEHPLPKKDELNIYRIVQELLTNTLRHAGASRVEISLNSQPRLLQLTYRDDGKGLSENGQPKKGLGLKNMESRVNALSGKLVIKSPPEGGILITIKIKNDEKDNQSSPV